MRNIDEIEDDIIKLVTTTNLENDPAAPILYKDLFIELQEAKGFIITETRCPQCDMKLDKDDEWARCWEFRYGPDKKPEIIYICPVCKIETPLKIIDPAHNAFLN